MGDAVNTAARLMQQASKPDCASRLLVDEATMSYTSAKISYKPLPPVQLKGKAEAMALYAPTAELAGDEEAEVCISRMGRDLEYRQLRGMLRPAPLRLGTSPHSRHTQQGLLRRLRRTHVAAVQVSATLNPLTPPHPPSLLTPPATVSCTGMLSDLIVYNQGGGTIVLVGATKQQTALVAALSSLAPRA